MRWLPYTLPAALFAAVVALMAVPLSDEGRNRDPSRLPSPLVGGPVPAFDLPPVADGVPGGLSAAALRGRPSVVNFFASWCLPCVVEHPAITRLAREGHAVYGVNHRDRAEDAAAWLGRHGNPYTAVGFDPDARVSFDWGVTGIPETFLVDPRGRIVHRHVGPVMPADLEGTILPMLEAME